MSRLYPTLAAIISSTYHTIEHHENFQNSTLSGAVLGRSISRLVVLWHAVYFAWVKLNFQSLVYQNWNFAARSLDILRNARAITCGIINNRPLAHLNCLSINRSRGKFMPSFHCDTPCQFRSFHCAVVCSLLTSRDDHFSGSTPIEHWYQRSVTSYY